MAASSFHTLVLFAVVFAVALLSQPSSCRSITAVSPRRSAAADASPNSDLNGFAQGVVELAISIGSDTFREIDTLVNQTKDDDELKADLNSCQTLYGISTEALRKAVLNLKNKSYAEAKGLVAGADADAGVKCEELFKRSNPPVEKSPLTVRNGIYELLRSAALSSFDIS